MAKNVAKGFTIDLSNPEDPFRVILESIVNAYATDFENVDDPNLKPSRKLATGIIDRFGKLEGIKLPYGSESGNSALTMNSAVKAFEQLGLIKNSPVKVGKNTINSYDFTELMDNVINQVKTGQLPSEALQSAIPDLRPASVKATAGKRKVGQVSSAVLENMPDTDLAKDAQKFLESKGRAAQAPKAEPEKLTNQQALDRILDDTREVELVESGKLRAGIRAKQQLADMPLEKVEGIAGELVKGDAGALEKMGQFLNKNKGKLVRSIAPAVVGGGIGLAAKGAEALDYAMSSRPTGRDPESLSTKQLEDLLASTEGGGLTDEQRLDTSEFPPEVRDAEYLRSRIAEKKRPMKQGAEMQGDLERSTRFQDEMKRLMQQQQQKQGTAQ
jgi:hypothetical protein